MKLKKILLPLIPLTFFLSGCGQPNFELYAVKYGESLFPSSKIYANDALKKDLPFIWTFYLIKYGHQIILVDTGFSDKNLVQKYNIQNFTDPLKLLGNMGIKPEDVTDVIVTHRHVEHSGNINQFPNAQLFIQEDEFEDSPIQNNENLFQFIDKHTIYDHITMEKIGGHTPGSSIIKLNREGKDYYIVGDDCYFIDNCREQKPIGTAENIDNNRKFIYLFKNNVYDAILTFHDPKIFEQYENVEPWLAKIF